VIEQRSTKIRVTDLRALLRFGHLRVRALRDECIEESDTALREKLIGDGEELMRVIVTRLVGNDGEDAFAALDRVEGLFDYVSYALHAQSQ
jgi:hypothetical protein